MLKKFLPIALALALATGEAAAVSYAFTGFDDTAQTCAIQKVEGAETTTAIEIPDTYSSPRGIEYKVVELRKGALKDFPNVTTISIGKNIQTIGGTTVSKSGTNTMATADDCQNFSGCPKLQKFTVDSDNPYYTATAGGILMIKGMQTIVRVPQAMVVTDNTLKMSASSTSGCPGAFAENTTIKKLLLSPSYSVNQYGNSFNDMVNLQEFGVNGSSTPLHYTVSQGVLLSDDKTTLISFPPAKQTMSYSCPLDVKTIGYKAFANTNLYAVDMSYVTKIEKEAFRNSAITGAEISEHTTAVGSYTFLNAPRLSKITVKGEIDIPAYFALDCPNLAEVVLPRKAKSVGRSAFRGCAKLAKFPFDAAINFEADSIFAGCGFSEVAFTGTYSPASASANAFRLGKGMFCNNTNLTFINMRGITLQGDAMLSVGECLAQGCPNLRKVWFPDATYLNSSYSNYGIFGANPALDEIVLGGFDFERSLPIIRYTSGSYSPAMYLLTTGATMKKWPLSYFFETSNGATCNPTIYCEAYSMLDSDMRYGSYICPGANYYVPGGTQMYDGAKSEVKSVTPMFSIVAGEQDGKYTLTLSNAISGLTFGKVLLNGTDCGTVPDDGKLTSDVAAADVRSIDLYYTVNGIAMHTQYPNLLSGIGAAESEAAAGLTITATAIGATFSAEADYTVYDVAGSLAASGRGTTADLSALARGLYIVSATDGRATATAKIRR